MILFGKAFFFLIDKPGIYSLVEVPELREIVIEGKSGSDSE